jgi:hypothetical protein
LQGIGLSVFLYEYFQHSNQWELAGMFIFGILLVQNIFTFFGLKRTELLFFSLLFGTCFMFAFLEWLKVSHNQAATIVGLSLLTIVSMLEYTRYSSTSPFWYLVSSSIFLCGLFDLVEKTYFEFVFLLVSCFLVYLSVWKKSRMLLLVSTSAIFCYITYFTAQHFLNSIGWPMALIGLGLLLFALSAVAYKINKYYIMLK